MGKSRSLSNNQTEKKVCKDAKLLLVVTSRVWFVGKEWDWEEVVALVHFKCARILHIKREDVKIKRKNFGDYHLHCNS